MTISRVSRVTCEHVENGSEAPIFGFRLGDGVSLQLCEYCYDRLKAFVLQDILGNLAKEFAREMSRINFFKK